MIESETSWHGESEPIFYHRGNKRESRFTPELHYILPEKGGGIN